MCGIQADFRRCDEKYLSDYVFKGKRNKTCFGYQMVLKRGDERICSDHVAWLRGTVGWVKVGDSKWT
jgi:hypothetical protein